jgi:putative DNA primase/helicase
VIARFSVSIFPDLSGSNIRLEKLNLAELGEKVLTTKANDKFALPLIKLASFGDQRTDNNSLRHNANIKSISGVEGDYDNKEISFEEAVRRIREARLKALLYTSPSYTVAEPKWRVILPSSQDLPPCDRAKLMARANGVLGGILAGESFTLSQAFFYGSVNGNSAPQVEIVEGDFLDLRDDLDANACGRNQARAGINDAAPPPRPSNTSNRQADPELVFTAMVVVPNPDVDWVTWNNIGMAIFNATNGHERGFEAFDLWSRKFGANYNATDTRDRWQCYLTSPPTEIGAGTIFQKADEAQPGWRVLVGLSVDVINEVLHLSRLSKAQYETERKAKAKQLNMRVIALDDMIVNLRPLELGGEDNRQGTRIEFEPIAPWPDPVEGTTLIADMKEAIRKYVILSEHQALAISLWIIHTHAIEAADHTSRLQIKSPTMRCGKSTLLNTIAPMVAKPINTESITTASLFRLIERYQPTLLIDEADSFLKRDDGRDNEEMRGILNAGHARGGAVIRTVGEDFEPRLFKVFGPVAFAWLVKRNVHVAQTLEDRSITIELRRRLPSETITRLRSTKTGHLRDLARRASRWVSDYISALCAADPALPEDLSDRAMDNWRSLIAIADAMSDDLGRQARQAAVKIAEENIGTGEEDASQMALADVAAIFEARRQPQLSSQEVVSDLVALEDRPWAEWRRGSPLTKTSLARLLKPFGIRPKELRFGNTTVRGYERAPVMEAKDRFVDADEAVTVQDPDAL